MSVERGYIMKNNDLKFTLPMLEEPRPLRIRFRKTGDLQYISHLDLQRTFARVLVRAGLPLWYTKGFNPHIKMVFGLPLSVGTESECEFLDIRIERDMSEKEIKERLNGEVTEEMAVTAVYRPVRKFTDIAFAEYVYTVTAPGIAAACDRVRALFEGGPLVVLKRSKSGEKETDIRPLIRRVTVEPSGDDLTVTAVLAAGEGGYLNPEYLITVLREQTGLLTGDPVTERYRILRRRVLLADGETEFA